MSSTHSSGKRRSGNKRKKLNGKVRIFKLLDPLCQGILLITCLLCLDSDSANSYKPFLQSVLLLQVVSYIINYLLSPPGQRKRFRAIYVIALLLYAGPYFLLERKIIHPGGIIIDGMKFNITEIVIVTIGIAIAFWYNFVCFLEAKSIQKRMENLSTPAY